MAQEIIVPERIFLEKEIIIETVNKEDGKSIHDIPDIPKFSLQELRNNQ